MTLFEQARAWLPGMVQAAAGVSVIYTRGVRSITVTAVVGRQAMTSVIQNRVRVEWGDRDYLIAVADLTFGEPALGDRITETIDGVAVTFEVQTPDTGEPAARHSDPQRTTWRIHVKGPG